MKVLRLKRYYGNNETLEEYGNREYSEIWFIDDDLVIGIRRYLNQDEYINTIHNTAKLPVEIASLVFDFSKEICQHSILSLHDPEIAEKIEKIKREYK